MKYKLRFPLYSLAELLLRIVLSVILYGIQGRTPFQRSVQHHDWPLYNFPTTNSPRVSDTILLVSDFVMYLFLACLTEVHHFLMSFTHGASFAATEELTAFKYDQGQSERLQSACKQPVWKWLFLRQLRLFWAVTLTILLTGLTTDLIKDLVGRPRPDFLDRCRVEGFDPLKPDFMSLPPIPVCTNADIEVVNDGRRSFPSGHASLSFSVCAFSALLVYFVLLKPLPRALGSIRFVASFLFLLPAVYCSISRTMDYRHHYEDVIVGATLGIAFSVVCFYLYYSFPRKLRKKRREGGDRCDSGKEDALYSVDTDEAQYSVVAHSANPSSSPELHTGDDGEQRTSTSHFRTFATHGGARNHHRGYGDRPDSRFNGGRSFAIDTPGTTGDLINV